MLFLIAAQADVAPGANVNYDNPHRPPPPKKNSWKVNLCI
ncbi:hypothetical protein GKKCFE_14525 [Pseudomonas sp. E141]